MLMFVPDFADHAFEDCRPHRGARNTNDKWTTIAFAGFRIKLCPIRG